MKQVTPEMLKFLELEKRKNEVKKYFEELNAATEAVAKQIGIGGMFQDPTDGTVFKIIEPDGQWVTYSKIGYKRTRRHGEERGDLSLKEAEAAGFNISLKK